MTQEIINRLTRPIVGIENRSAQEAFDIMADRIRGLSTLTPSGVERIRAELIEALVKGTRLDISYEEATDAVEDAFAALALPSEPPSQGDVEGRAREEVEEMRFWLRKAGEVLAPHSADPAGTPTRDALVFVNAGLNHHARPVVRAALASKEDGRS